MNVSKLCQEKKIDEMNNDVSSIAPYQVIQSVTSYNLTPVLMVISRFACFRSTLLVTSNPTGI